MTPSKYKHKSVPKHKPKRRQPADIPRSFPTRTIYDGKSVKYFNTLVDPVIAQWITAQQQAAKLVGETKPTASKLLRQLFYDGCGAFFRREVCYIPRYPQAYSKATEKVSLWVFSDAGKQFEQLCVDAQLTKCELMYYILHRGARKNHLYGYPAQILAHQTTKKEVT